MQGEVMIDKEAFNKYFSTESNIVKIKKEHIATIDKTKQYIMVATGVKGGETIRKKSSTFSSHFR